MTTETNKPVAAQTRWRSPEIGRPDWSVWQPAVVSESNPAWCIDSQGYEVEYRLLYTTPPNGSVTDAMIDKAMNARMPGGSTAWVWLFNCEGGHQPEEKHRDWFRAVLTAAITGSRSHE